MNSNDNMTANLANSNQDILMTDNNQSRQPTGNRSHSRNRRRSETDVAVYDHLTRNGRSVVTNNNDTRLHNLPCLSTLSPLPTRTNNNNNTRGTSTTSNKPNTQSSKSIPSTTTSSSTKTITTTTTARTTTMAKTKRGKKIGGNQGIIPISEGWPKIYDNGIRPFLNRVVEIGSQLRSGATTTATCESTIPQQQYS